MARTLVGATFAAALASGLVAGVFWAFSSFIMAGLSRLTPPQGISAMSSINVTVIGSGFLITLLVTAVASIALAIANLAAWQGSSSWLYLAACFIYLVGVVGVTMACNVPLNESLAHVDPTSAEAAAMWARFVPSWTAWNHVRTLSAFAASAAYVAGLVFRP